jgi:hypothetical protein
MPDISSIAAGISSVKLAMDLAKGIKDASTALADAEVKFKVAELMTTIADVKIHLIDAQDENNDLKLKIKALETLLKQKDDVTFRDGYYYLANPKEGKPDGPFCSNCYSIKDTLSLLTEVTGTFRRFGKYTCPSCDQRFGQ